MFGDFNLPHINWTNIALKNTTHTPISNALFEFMDQNLLTQYVNHNTRNNNILDLFLTDNSRFVDLIEVEEISFSDHSLVKIYTTFFSNSAINSNESSKAIDNQNSKLDFSAFNLYSTNYDKMNAEFSTIDWPSIVNDSIDKFPERFHNIVFSVIKKNLK